jgi:hypothetical protein
VRVFVLWPFDNLRDAKTNLSFVIQHQWCNAASALGLPGRHAPLLARQMLSIMDETAISRL